MNAPVLAARDLHVAYGDVDVVRGVDLVVRPGEKVGIVGESGSGKSTLALAVMGLLAGGGRIASGTVELLGSPVDHGNEKAMDGLRGKSIALVPQDPLTSLDPVKTIGSQIAEALRRHQPKRSRAQLTARAAELLTSVGVPDATAKLRQYPHEFSGGMRQRVLIAIAIANDPAVLIADEPTTALDVTTQAQVVELLDSLVERLGIAVVLVSHDIGVVSEFCDRVFVMYAGRLVEQVPAGNLFGQVAHPYSRALLDSLPLPGRSRHEELVWIPGAPPAMTALPPGCSFAPRCRFADETCRTVAPPQVVVDPARTHLAECHHLDRVGAGRQDVDLEGSRGV
ncbi:ABC transporter ATP-binding protein [Kineococcus sp. SYSU DK003]|uniref:ABC transporter ATP-binding protein n=1 Tax=Kineococcus sp. SYSU DK003 TaxID=3383124 RepID=UPI003D7D6774